MSYGVTLYAVDLADLRAKAAERAPRLARLRESHGGWMASLDDWFTRDIEAGAPTAERALEALLAQTPPAALEKQHAFVYAYAFEILCDDAGARLANGAVYPASPLFVEEVDRALDALRIASAFRLSRLAFGGAPVELPTPADFPSIGFVDAKTVARAADQLDGAHLHDSLPEPVRAAIAELHEAAATAEGRSLVGFYY